MPLEEMNKLFSNPNWFVPTAPAAPRTTELEERVGEVTMEKEGMGRRSDVEHVA